MQQLCCQVNGYSEGILLVQFLEVQLIKVNGIKSNKNCIVFLITVPDVW